MGIETLLELNRQLGFSGLTGPMCPRKWWQRWVELWDCTKWTSSHHGIHFSNAMKCLGVRSRHERNLWKETLQVQSLVSSSESNLHWLVLERSWRCYIQCPFYDGFFRLWGSRWPLGTALFDGNSSRDTLHYDPFHKVPNCTCFTSPDAKSSLLVKDELRSWWNQHCPVLHLWNLWICNFCSHTKWWSWMKLDASHHPLMVNVMSSTSS